MPVVESPGIGSGGVASVVVGPSPVSVNVGSTVQMGATVFDNTGNPLSGVAVSWGSSNNNIASVSNSGVVTGIAAGTASITGTAGGVQATATVTVSYVPGSVAKVQGLIGDGNIKWFYVPKLTNAVGATASVPDARTGSVNAGPALTSVGTSPNLGSNGYVQFRSNGRLMSPSSALFGHDITKSYAIVGVMACPSNGFTPLAMGSTDFSALMTLNNGPTIAGAFGGGSGDSKVALSAQPMMFSMQHFAPLNVGFQDDHTTGGQFLFEVLGSLPKASYAADATFANGQLSLGGFAAASAFLNADVGMVARIDKQLLLPDINTLTEFAEVNFPTVGPTLVKPFAFIAIGDSLQAGNYAGPGGTVSATTTYVDLLAAESIMANYDYGKRATGGIKAAEQALMFDFLHAPSLRPLQWARMLIVLGLGTNDRFHGTTANAALGVGTLADANNMNTLFDAMCQKIRTAHPNAIIVVTTVPPSGFWQEGSDVWLQTVNPHRRGMVAAGLADAVLDMGAIAGFDPVGLPANFVDTPGVHPVQALQNTMETALKASVAALI